MIKSVPHRSCISFASLSSSAFREAPGCEHSMLAGFHVPDGAGLTEGGLDGAGGADAGKTGAGVVEAFTPGNERDDPEA